LSAESPPRREVLRAEARAWLDATAAPAHASVITSMPDLSEMRVEEAGFAEVQLGLPRWRAWFEDTARRVIRWVPEGGVSIFFQSDIRVGGALVDKGYLVMRAAEAEGASVLWHKIVCRRPPGSVSMGRPGYSHLIGVTRGAIGAIRKPGPEVLADAGFMPWSRAMGVDACRLACRYLVENTDTRVVVDPFCGKGTVLAVANAMGLDAIGVELSIKRCKAARSLTIEA
jgi:hypothetical protein